MSDSQLPNPFSLAEIHDQLSTARSNLANVQRQIKDHPSHPNNLLRLEQCFAREIEFKNQVLKLGCFIDNLLDEILVQIFLHLVQEWAEGRTEGETYPWRFMIVCRRWKRICLDHPRLWSYVNTFSGHSHHDASASAYPYQAWLVARTMLQLHRSQKAPLFVRAWLDCDCPSQIERFLVLTSHSSRWETVDFTIPPESRPSIEHLRRARDLLPGASKFPNLLKVSLVADGQAESNKFLPLSDHTALPRLKDVVLYDVAGTTSIIGDSSFSWASLTSLSLERYEGSIHDLLTVISHCQHLTSFSVSEACLGERLLGTDLRPSDLPTAVLLHLRKITISDINDMGLFTHVLPNLQLPALRILNLDVYIPEAGTIQPVLDLLQKASCGESLRELDLEILTHSPSEVSTHVIPILKLCPNLHVLITSSYSNNGIDGLLQSLVIQDGSEPLCPRLRELFLKRTPFRPMFMIQMIESRINVMTGVILRSVSILYPPKASSASGREWMFRKTFLERKYKHDESGFTLTFKPDEW